MKVLMLNISIISNDNDTKNIKGFFISFELIIQNADAMITNLINRAFTHSIGMIFNHIINVNTKNVDTEISIIDSNSNFFVYIVTERYTVKRFYNIIIDTNASKHFTIDYEQFLIYNKNNNEQIFINTKNVKVVHVQFEIDSISFMKLMNVTTFIESMKFYVVKIDTSFLLCLNDMNRLKIYYNNIKNIFTSNNMSMSVIRRFSHLFLL